MHLLIPDLPSPLVGSSREGRALLLCPAISQATSHGAQPIHTASYSPKIPHATSFRPWLRTPAAGVPAYSSLAPRGRRRRLLQQVPTRPRPCSSFSYDNTTEMCAPLGCAIQIPGAAGLPPTHALLVVGHMPHFGNPAVTLC